MIAGWVWRVVATLAEPAVRLLLRWRLARGKELAGRVGERRGLATLPRPAGRLLWLHAASVGETMSVLPLMEALCGLDGELQILMTTGSATSARLLLQRLRSLPFSARVRHQFVPLDVPRWLRRFLRHWRPQALGLVESELWPNLIAAACASRVPVALLNARLSARSQRGWQKLPGLARAMLRRLRWVTARSDEDAARLRALGGIAVDSPGDLKASAPPLPVDEAELNRLREVLEGRPVLLAASTHPGEELLIARAHRVLAGTRPRLLTIIAPRHPGRGAVIAEALDGAPRRSLGQDPAPEAGFWVCDTLGEMGLLYRLSAAAFLGNSLDAAVPGGGHNPFEPARLGCALATGPASFNFKDAVGSLLAAEAIAITPTPDAIADWAGGVLDHPERRRAAARAGERVASRASDLAPALAARLLALVDEARR